MKDWHILSDGVTPLHYFQDNPAEASLFMYLFIFFAQTPIHMVPFIVSFDQKQVRLSLESRTTAIFVGVGRQQLRDNGRLTSL